MTGGKIVPFAFLAGAALSIAADINNYSDAPNRRFTDDITFIGSIFDLSGVGRLSQLSPADSLDGFREGTWATAIGPNYFLSARHFYPDAGSEITFYAGNSTSSPSFTYVVAGGFQVGSTDLWIGYTLEEMDPSIARYTYATQAADTLQDLGLGNSTLYLSGDRLAGRPGVTQDHVLGTNRAEFFYNEGGGVPSGPGTENDMIGLIQHLDGDDSAPLFHETLLQAGDSGSPLFTASGTILGVASTVLTLEGNFITSPGPPGSDPLEEREATFYSYTGSYTTELDAAIGMVPEPIPEPNSVILATVGMTICLRRRR